MAVRVAWALFQLQVIDALQIYAEVHTRLHATEGILPNIIYLWDRGQLTTFHKSEGNPQSQERVSN